MTQPFRRLDYLDQRLPKFCVPFVASSLVRERLRCLPWPAGNLAAWGWRDWRGRALARRPQENDSHPYHPREEQKHSGKCSDAPGQIGELIGFAGAERIKLGGKHDLLCDWTKEPNTEPRRHTSGDT